MIIAIDGPSGTGKSTVAKEVAKRLRFAFFDTGAGYRSVAWWVLHKGIDPLDQETIVKMIPEFKYEIRMSKGGEKRYFVDGTEITAEIRSQKISMAASQVAIYPEVRHNMVRIQREYAEGNDVVFEGRDMGTVVFPHADLKIFLNARPEIRAERRYKELKTKNPDLKTSFEELLKETASRDDADTHRTISPLKKARDAILIDTSDITADQVVEKILALKPKRKFLKMKWFYWVVDILAVSFFKCFYGLKVYGLEHFGPGGAIIAANHSSFFDPPVLSASCPEEVHFLAKGSLFDVPILGFAIRKLNAHPVTRDVSDMQTFRTMIELLMRKNKLILFPEGQRSLDGELLPLERGLSFLVQKSGCRIIPTYIHGAFQAWPPERKWPKLFGKISVVFGSSIEWDESLDKKAAQEKITNDTENALRALKAWMEAGAKGSPP